MRITEQASLRLLNTFRVEARAALRIDLESEEDVLALPPFDPGNDLVLGGGSNTLLVSGVPGTVYVNRIVGRALVGRDGGNVIIEVGAGEDWHQLVLWCLEQGLCGLENLSLIPGSVGAAPMQNIGAYGVELASVLDSVTAWDWHRQQWRSFTREECHFAYRDSRFKSGEPDRYLITSVRLVLPTAFVPQIAYPGLVEELNGVPSGELTPRLVSEAVIRIRRRKLPDPALIGNAGSFFKNPVLPGVDAESIRMANPGLPCWPAGEGRVKLSAAWLIEQCGLKGHANGAAAVSEQHALVLVNKGGASGLQLWRLACEVREKVEQAFGIRLDPEPRIVNFDNPGVNG